MPVQAATVKVDAVMGGTTNVIYIFDAGEDDGIKTRTIVGNKLCLWNRCAEECCDFYAGGCPDEPPDDSASPERPAKRVRPARVTP